MSSSRTSYSSTSRGQYLSEQFIQDSFHSYLKSSLSQAKAERLLDVEVLASAEGDLMITGPALCLYFAALRCTTNPPSVPLPRQSKSTSSSASASAPQDLSFENCPPPFVGFLRVWADTVPQIQALPPERQHDLARAICGLPPSTTTSSSASRAGGSVGGPVYEIRALAADLRAVAIEISQRRSFQDRYAEDLQAVLDASGEGGSAAPGAPRRASFVPPPTYDEAASPSAPRRRSHPDGGGGGAPALPARPALLSVPGPGASNGHADAAAPLSPSFAGLSSSSSSAAGNAPPPSPTLLAPDSPAILFIRETLYAALADVLEREPALRRLLSPQNSNSPRDRPRAYFACLAYAILSVARTNVTPLLAPPGSTTTTLLHQHQPNHYLPPVVPGPSPGGNCMGSKEDVPSMMRIERVYGISVGGMGADANDEGGAREGWYRGGGYGYGGESTRSTTRSVQGRAMAFGNRVNVFALGACSYSQAWRGKLDDRRMRQHPGLMPMAESPNDCAHGEDEGQTTQVARKSERVVLSARGSKQEKA